MVTYRAHRRVRVSKQDRVASHRKTRRRARSELLFATSHDADPDGLIVPRPHRTAGVRCGLVPVRPVSSRNRRRFLADRRAARRLRRARSATAVAAVVDVERESG